MNTATIAQPLIAEAQTATLFVALELSKATWLVARRHGSLRCMRQIVTSSASIALQGVTSRPYSG